MKLTKIEKLIVEIWDEQPTVKNKLNEIINFLNTLAEREGSQLCEHGNPKCSTCLACYNKNIIPTEETKEWTERFDESFKNIHSGFVIKKFFQDVISQEKSKSYSEGVRKNMFSMQDELVKAINEERDVITPAINAKVNQVLQEILKTLEDIKYPPNSSDSELALSQAINIIKSKMTNHA